MAKISFSKLNLKKQNKTEIINFNEQDIEVKQYLPIQDKLELLTRAINQTIQSSNKYYNPGQLSLIFKLELIYSYTNINFTDKQKEEFTKTFDLMEENGLIKVILDAIPTTEIQALEAWLLESIKSVYAYTGSARAILDTIQEEFSGSQMNLENLQQQLQDPTVLSLLKEILPLMNLD